MRRAGAASWAAAVHLATERLTAERVGLERERKAAGEAWTAATTLADRSLATEAGRRQRRCQELQAQLAEGETQLATVRGEVLEDLDQAPAGQTCRLRASRQPVRCAGGPPSADWADAGQPVVSLTRGLAHGGKMPAAGCEPTLRVGGTSSAGVAQGRLGVGPGHPVLRGPSRAHTGAGRAQSPPRRDRACEPPSAGPERLPPSHLETCSSHALAAVTSNGTSALDHVLSQAFAVVAPPTFR